MDEQQYKHKKPQKCRSKFKNFYAQVTKILEQILRQARQGPWRKQFANESKSQECSNV